MRYLLYIPTGTAVSFQVSDKLMTDLDDFISYKQSLKSEFTYFNSIEHVIKDVVDLITLNDILNKSFIKRNSILLPVSKEDFVIVTKE